ncbi:MAG: cupin domain-containing protein [Chloroflexi bacterium]|nr:cupin domain-containing protein [Chloroflexota bacterium]
MPKLYFASPRDLPTAKPQPGVTEHTLQGEGVTVRSVDLAPRTVVETHKHEGQQLGIVTRGSIAMVIAGEQRILTEGDTFIIPPGAAHGTRVLEQGAHLVAVEAAAKR